MILSILQATTFFRRVGIGPDIVGIKVNSRKVLSSILAGNGVPQDKFAPACVIIDKLDKIGGEEVVKQLVNDQSIPEKAARNILTVLSPPEGEADTIEKFCERVKDIVAPEDPALVEMRELFSLAGERL